MSRLTIQSIRRPVRTLGAALPDLEDELWALVVRAWGHAPAYRRTVRERFLEADRLRLARHDGKLVGFSAVGTCRIARRPVFVIFGTVVDPEYQGRALSIRLNKLPCLVFNMLHPLRGVMTTRTQSPRLLGSILDHGPAYPNPYTATPPDLQEVAVEVGRLIAPDKPVCRETLVMRGAMPLPLSIAPRDDAHHRPEIVAFCRAHLDYARGDAFVVVSRWRAYHTLFHQLVPVFAHRLATRLSRRARRDALACSNGTAGS